MKKVDDPSKYERVKKVDSKQPRLLLSIFFWVCFFGVLFWLCGVLLTQQWSWFSVPDALDTNEEHFFELLTSVLATIGGIIAISYLVIKYRERSDQERGQKLLTAQQTNQDLRAAIEQLGHEKPVVRIAGVHALLDISDAHGGIYKQRIVDVLCGYLRADRSSTEDRAVESTILQAIQKRTWTKSFLDDRGEEVLPQIVGNDQSWCDCTFDLHGATFTEDFNLDGSTFTGDVNFAEAIFTAPATFNHATFLGRVDFSSCQFKEMAFFIKTEFESPLFFGATFHNHASFIEADFHDVPSFHASYFQAPADFRSTRFRKSAIFNYAVFSILANFRNAVFQHEVTYYSCKFNGQAVFENVRFKDRARYNEATFQEAVSFVEATFQSEAQFHKALFNPNYKTEVAFPPSVAQEDNLPEGAQWISPESSRW